MSDLRLSGGEEFIPSAEIAERTRKLAEYYDSLYGCDEVAVITVLEGASRFAKNLTGAMNNPFVLEDTIRVRSMNGTERTEPKLVKDTDIHIKGLDVLVVEDVDDSGSTADFVLNRLVDQSPKSIRFVSLLDKPEEEKAYDELRADEVHYGFRIASKFVVGHGLDWNDPATGRQYYRSLNHITEAVNIRPAGEPKFFVPVVPVEPTSEAKILRPTFREVAEIALLA